MPTCSFCKKSYQIPRGLTIFQFDGKAIHYCSSKCRRNAGLKRDPKKTDWVKRVKKEKSSKKIENKEEIKNKTIEKVEDKIVEEKQEVKKDKVEVKKE